MTSTVFPMLIRSIGRVDSNCIVHLGELSVKAFWFNWTSVLWMPLECKTCLTIFSNNKRGFLRGVAVTACNHFSEIFAFRDVISVEMGWIYLWGLPISAFNGTIFTCDDNSLIIKFWTKHVILCYRVCQNQRSIFMLAK